MYSRQEAAELRKAFWTAYGQYMLPVPGAEGEKVNWVNYKTGIKHLHFKMEADGKKAWVGIELSHADDGLRHLYYEQLEQLKHLLVEATGEEWIWESDLYEAGGRQVSRISIGLDGVSIFKKEDWPRLISFFKQRMMALDLFWSSARYAFEALA